MPVRPRGLSGLFCSSKRNSPSYETRVFQSSGPSPLISGSAHPPGFVTRLFSITAGWVYAIGEYDAHDTDHGTFSSGTGVLSG